MGVRTKSWTGFRQLGLSIRQIAAQTGYNRATIKKYGSQEDFVLKLGTPPVIGMGLPKSYFACSSASSIF